MGASRQNLGLRKDMPETQEQKEKGISPESRMRKTVALNLSQLGSVNSSGLE